MSPRLPDGEPAPPDGALPPDALAALGDGGLGVYVHVPFCATRCGYCDFNTYTASELGGTRPQDYLAAARAELALARRVLGADDRAMPTVRTVFFGGGTPTLLPADELAGLLDAVRATFPLADDVEVSTEANPETVDERYLRVLRGAGFTRLSLGMQSARPHVLEVLERVHSPGRASRAAAQARETGFDHVNLDLIYGTPGETDADWQASLDEVVAAGVDHVSAYALIMEDGTRLARQVRTGQLPAPDDDVVAERYLMAERTLSAGGFAWYEVSNWALGPGSRCRHNELYWRGGDWWGVGPGAHSHVGGVRWWNVKHPGAYVARLAADASPAHAREVLHHRDRYVERVMLALRTRDGLALSELDAAGREEAGRAVSDGLLSATAHRGGVAVLTLRGRLLADAVIRHVLS